MALSAANTQDFTALSPAGAGAGTAEAGSGVSYDSQVGVSLSTSATSSKASYFSGGSGGRKFIANTDFIDGLLGALKEAVNAEEASLYEKNVNVLLQVILCLKQTIIL